VDHTLVFTSGRSVDLVRLEPHVAQGLELAVNPASRFGVKMRAAVLSYCTLQRCSNILGRQAIRNLRLLKSRAGSLGIGRFRWRDSLCINRDFAGSWITLYPARGRWTVWWSEKRLLAALRRDATATRGLLPAFA